MNQASNIKVILPTLKSDRGYTELGRFSRDFDDKLSGLQHGKSLVKLKNHLAGRPDHTATVAPSFLSVPGLSRTAPDEETVESAESDTGGILSPSKPSGTPSTSQRSQADITFYWQLSQESKDLDEYMFGQLQSAVEGAFKTHLDSVRNRSYIEGMLILHNIERLSRVMDLMGMWDKFVDISINNELTSQNGTQAYWPAGMTSIRDESRQKYSFCCRCANRSNLFQRWRCQSCPQYSMTLSRTTLR